MMVLGCGEPTPETRAPAPFAAGREKQLASLAALIVQMRRRRETVLGGGLFADPAWDMLLDLYIAEVSGRSVSVSSLSIGAAVPATTALRWMGILTRRGLATREGDRKDGRRTFVRITPAAREGIEKLLVELIDGPKSEV